MNGILISDASKKLTSYGWKFLLRRCYKCRLFKLTLEFIFHFRCFILYLNFVEKFRFWWNWVWDSILIQMQANLIKNLQMISWWKMSWGMEMWKFYVSQVDCKMTQVSLIVLIIQCQKMSKVAWNFSQIEY